MLLAYEVRLAFGNALAIFVCANVGACSDHDIGQPCPHLIIPGDVATGDGSRTETQEVVEQNALFPCDELICIATDGKPGYCSKKCREDAGCPEGFECRTVQAVGSFADDKFCAWKRCENRSDCGNKDDFCCRSIDSGAAVERRICDFREKGKCS